MDQELLDVVNEYRGKGISITDEEAEFVRSFCLRKMEVAKIINQQEYLPFLFRDELKNHLFRRAINAKAMLNMMRKEAI